jgi:hypothetical protein
MYYQCISVVILNTKKIRVARSYAYFQTKNPNLGNFSRVFRWKMWVYFKFIWYFCGHLLYFLYFFPVLVCSTKKNLATLNELLSKNHFCQLAVVRVLTVFEFAATNKQ